MCIRDSAEAVRDTGHSCFPVVSDDLDDVLGFLFVNDLFRSSTVKRAIGVSLPTAEEITRKIRRPLMLPETFDLLESLGQMRAQRRTFALVLDEHGGVAGVVSSRDILEQLVGDLNDEFDLSLIHISSALVNSCRSCPAVPPSAKSTLGPP